MYKTILVLTGSFWLLPLYLWTDITMQGCAYLVGWSFFSCLKVPSPTRLISVCLCSILHSEACKVSSSCQTLACVRNHPEALLESRFLSPCPRDSDSVRLEWAWECTCLTSSQVMPMVWDSLLGSTALVEYPSLLSSCAGIPRHATWHHTGEHPSLLLVCSPESWLHCLTNSQQSVILEILPKSNHLILAYHFTFKRVEQ